MPNPNSDQNAIVRDGRVILVALPTGYSSKHYPLVVGQVYRVCDLDGSNVVLGEPSGLRDETYSVSRSRVRAMSDWERTDGGAWQSFCDGVRFFAVRVKRGWRVRAHDGADECVKTARTRDAAVVELYEIVRDNRETAAAEQRATAFAPLEDQLP